MPAIRDVVDSATGKRGCVQKHAPGSRSLSRRWATWPKLPAPVLAADVASPRFARSWPRMRATISSVDDVQKGRIRVGDVENHDLQPVGRASIISSHPDVG